MNYLYPSGSVTSNGLMVARPGGWPEDGTPVQERVQPVVTPSGWVA